MQAGRAGQRGQETWSQASEAGDLLISQALDETHCLATPIWTLLTRPWDRSHLLLHQPEGPLAPGPQVQGRAADLGPARAPPA